jgi:hypothetical protein
MKLREKSSTNEKAQSMKSVINKDIERTVSQAISWGEINKHHNCSCILNLALCIYIN